MTSKYFTKKIHTKIFKSCFKFVFLTKNFKERNQLDILKTFSKILRLETSKYKLFFFIIKNSNFMKTNKCTH